MKTVLRGPLGPVGPWAWPDGLAQNLWWAGRWAVHIVSQPGWSAAEGGEVLPDDVAGVEAEVGVDGWLAGG